MRDLHRSVLHKPLRGASLASRASSPWTARASCAARCPAFTGRHCCELYYERRRHLVRRVQERRLVLAVQRPRATSASKQVAVKQNCEISTASVRLRELLEWIEWRSMCGGREEPCALLPLPPDNNKYVGEALPFLFLYDGDGGRRRCCCYLGWWLRLWLLRRGHRTTSARIVLLWLMLLLLLSTTTIYLYLSPPSPPPPHSPLLPLLSHPRLGPSELLLLLA